MRGSWQIYDRQDLGVNTKGDPCASNTRWLALRWCGVSNLKTQNNRVVTGYPGGKRCWGNPWVTLRKVKAAFPNVLLIWRPSEHQTSQIIQAKENASRLWTDGGCSSETPIKRLTDFFSRDGFILQAGLRHCLEAKYTKRSSRLHNTRPKPLC